MIEARGGKVGVQTNCGAPVAINILKDAIVALAQAMVREEKKQMVVPVKGGLPPLRRIP